MLDAVDYCRQLSDLLARVSVTDAAGASLGLSPGGKLAAQLVLEARLAGKKIMVIGNGGSAAIAAHLHNDLSKAVGVRSLCFQDTPLLTALSNDEGYERGYERGVEQWAQAGDVLVAVSSSGRSANILRAAAAAGERGCRLLTLTGFAPDNPLRKLGEVNFHVPCAQYGLVELAHGVIAHYVTDAAMAAVSSARSLTEEKSHGVRTDSDSAGDGGSRLRRGRLSA